MERKKKKIKERVIELRITNSRDNKKKNRDKLNKGFEKVFRWRSEGQTALERFTATRRKKNLGGHKCTSGRRVEGGRKPETQLRQKGDVKF